MFKVEEIYRLNGSCMICDDIKVFYTKFFAKRYFSKKCKQNDYTSIKEKFGDQWVTLASHSRNANDCIN